MLAEKNICLDKQRDCTLKEDCWRWVLMSGTCPIRRTAFVKLLSLDMMGHERPKVSGNRLSSSECTIRDWRMLKEENKTRWRRWPKPHFSSDAGRLWIQTQMFAITNLCPVTLTLIEVLNNFVVIRRDDWQVRRAQRIRGRQAAA